MTQMAEGKLSGWCHELLVLNATDQTFLLLSVCAEVHRSVYAAWTEQFELSLPMLPDVSHPLNTVQLYHPRAALELHLCTTNGCESTDS